MAVEDDVRRLDEKQKESFLQAEKRLVNLESAMQNLSLRIQQGSLAPEQEQRVALVEEKLENVEDLQMVANLDIIKIREAVDKLQSGGAGAYSGAAGTAASAPENMPADVESRLDRLEGRVDDIASAKSSGGGRAAKTEAPAAGEMKKMREDFESFRAETEESVKIIVNSIRKILEKIK